MDYIVVIQRKGYDPLLFVGDFTGAEGGVVDEVITMFTFP